MGSVSTAAQPHFALTSSSFEYERALEAYIKMTDSLQIVGRVICHVVAHTQRVAIRLDIAGPTHYIFTNYPF